VGVVNGFVDGECGGRNAYGPRKRGMGLMSKPSLGCNYNHIKKLGQVLEEKTNMLCSINGCIVDHSWSWTPLLVSPN